VVDETRRFIIEKGQQTPRPKSADSPRSKRVLRSPVLSFCFCVSVVLHRTPPTTFCVVLSLLAHSLTALPSSISINQHPDLFLRPGRLLPRLSSEVSASWLKPPFDDSTQMLCDNRAATSRRSRETSPTEPVSSDAFIPAVSTRAPAVGVTRLGFRSKRCLSSPAGRECHPTMLPLSSSEHTLCRSMFPKRRYGRLPSGLRQCREYECCWRLTW
jgi:hypothetical protein